MKRLIMFVMFMLLIVLWSDVYARPVGSVPFGGGGGGVNHPMPNNPVFVRHQKDFAELSAERVFNEFFSENLADSPVMKNNKQIQFKYKAFTGRICEFSNERKLSEAQEEALDLNSKGIKNNWSMTHKNVILVIDGEMPLIEWLKFQEALRKL